MTPFPFLTYITGIEHCSIIPAHFRKGVALVAEQPVHVPNKAQVLLVPTRLAYRTPPLLNGFQDLGLNAGWSDRRSLGEPSDELIEELLGADLKMKGVTAILHANVEQLAESVSRQSHMFRARLPDDIV